MEEIQTIAVLGKALAISSSRTYLYRHAEETSIDSDQLACSCMYSVLDKHAQGDGRPRIRPWKLGDSWRTESSLPHPQARPPRPASGDEQTKEETAVAHGSGVGTTADGDLRGFRRLRIAARRRLLARRAAGTSGVASCRAAAPFGERYRGPPVQHKARPTVSRTSARSKRWEPGSRARSGRRWHTTTAGFQPAATVIPTLAL
jgi:hypothetical protein